MPLRISFRARSGVMNQPLVVKNGNQLLVENSAALAGGLLKGDINAKTLKRLANTPARCIAPGGGAASR